MPNFQDIFATCQIFRIYLSHGLRVVRGPDWEYGDTDGGEGHVGTIVRGEDKTEQRKNTVLVCWDNGNQCICRKSNSGPFDLRIVDNSFAGVSHEGYICHECHQHPIKGMLWHCDDCVNCDLCTQCYMADKHQLDHCFQRRVKQGDNFVSVGKRDGATKLQLQGIFKGAKVCRGRDWKWGDQDGGAGKEGHVLDIVPWDGVNRARALVTWAGFFRLIRSNWHHYRVGYEGKVDLKCVTASTGPTCYVNHLPKLGETAKPAGIEASAYQSQINVGDRVVINLDKDILRQTAEGHGGWVPDMENVIGKVGVVERIGDRGDIHARWGLIRWMFHPAVFTKVEAQHLRAGDKVRVIPNKVRLMALQEGHGGWNESMTSALGQEGHVMEVDDDGDAVVIVGSSLWLFNSEALILESAKSDRVPEGEQSRLRGSSLKEDLLFSLLAELALAEKSVLVSAASRGDLAKVKEILESNPEKINDKSNGKIPLHVACHQGNADVVTYLLSKGANKNILDEQSYSALHHAAYGDDSGQTVQVLLNHGANVNLTNNKNKSAPLHLAVARDKHLNVEKLVKFRHTDVNLQDDSGDTPLHNAILKKSNKIVDIILTSGTLDVTVCNHKGFNPLHLSCLLGYQHCVEKLSERFPGLVDIPKEDGFTALHLAVYNNHKDVVQVLLLTGHCNINIKTNNGQTALMLATDRIHTEMIELLVEHGTEINAEDNDGDTALHIAIMAQSVSSLGQFAEELGLKLPKKEGEEFGCATACYLAMHGADLQHHNHHGKTPLDLCMDPAVRSRVQRFAPAAVQNHQQQQPRLDAPLAMRDPPNNGVLPGASNVTQPMEPGGIRRENRARKQVKFTAAVNDLTMDANLSTTVPDVKDSSLSIPALPPLSPTAGNCVICDENVAAVTFKPCGHRITCTGCSIRVKRCLNCQKDIEQKVSPEGAPLTTNCLDLENFREKFNQIQERLASMERGMECAICMERQRCIIFQCGHGTCRVCSARIQKCPMCKEQISSRTQMY